MYRLLLFVIAALVAVLTVGCAPTLAGSPGTTTTAPTEAVTPNPAASEAPVPGLAAGAAEWLAAEVKVPVTDLHLVAAERVEWTDSCFGLGGPAESCLQALTPGWRITFESARRQYEVRTDEAGRNFRLAPEAS